jgi:hypothetical protein
LFIRQVDRNIVINRDGSARNDKWLKPPAENNAQIRRRRNYGAGIKVHWHTNKLRISAIESALHAVHLGPVERADAQHRVDCASHDLAVFPADRHLRTSPMSERRSSSGARAAVESKNFAARRDCV